MRNYKKIILIIVEGPADDEALSLPLTQIFSNSTVRVEIMHGDITTDYGSNSSNIVKKIHDRIKSFLNNNHFLKSDIEKIIHITDTDGTFIPEENIILDPAINRFIYSENNIKTNNKNNVINRNKQKASCLRQLIRTSKIGGIQYNIFYMSCNLDHVLFNRLNLTDSDKENLSIQFAINCQNGKIDFASFIVDPQIAVSGNYRETWTFIQTKNNSLKRHTNLGVSFPKQS